MVRTYIDSPDGELEAVALSRPPRDLPDSLPASWSEMPDLKELHEEWSRLVGWLERSGREVKTIDIATKEMYDATFIRDIASVIGPYVLMTRSGVPHRQPEHNAACAAFLIQGIGRWPWAGAGKCEGADVLPVGPRVWYVGTGSRTDESGADHVLQWSEMQQDLVVYKVEKSGPPVPQHLLGGNRVVDGVLYTRTDVERMPWDGPAVIMEPDEEIVSRLAMNWLTLSPREVLMADDCTNMRDLLRSNGIEVYTLPMRQIRKMDGGFACCTLPLRRARARS